MLCSKTNDQKLNSKNCSYNTISGRCSKIKGKNSKKILKGSPSKNILKNNTKNKINKSKVMDDVDIFKDVSIQNNIIEKIKLKYKNFSRIGINPITLDESDIFDCIIKDENMIVLIHPFSNIPILINKNLISKVGDEVYKCMYSNNTLMEHETIKNGLYNNIGFFLGKPSILEMKELKKVVYNGKNQPNNKRIFVVSFPNDEKNYFMPKSVLEMSSIDIFKMKTDDKKNFKYGKNDIYFNILQNKALKDYSYQWDQVMNLYLREGNTYFENFPFLSRVYRYTSSYPLYSERWEVKESATNKIVYVKSNDKKIIKDIEPEQFKKYRLEAIKNVLDKVDMLDKCFKYYADRYQKETTLYRGMKFPYAPLDVSGSSMIHSNFISCSTAFSVAKSFAGKGIGRTIYEVLFPKGIPHIDMIATTQYKNEYEHLHPANLLLTHAGETIKNGTKVIKLIVSTSIPNQFTRYTGCKQYQIGKIERLEI